ncbi:MAG: MAPEG family protein [Acidovorax sp.]
MVTQSSVALAGFITWALLLLVLMESIRSWLVLSRQVPANGFPPDNSNLSPFMQRLAREHANCLEGLPIFGGLLILAIATDHTSVTDSLAYWLLAARVIQSLIHLASTSTVAVMARFSAFSVQMGIGLYWAAKLTLGS